MNQQQLQAWLDTYALVQAQRQLVLTDEQYPNFVPRLVKLQDIRRVAWSSAGSSWSNCRG
jgi:hypothetical protein